MKDKLGEFKAFINNPLGIIGLFLVLVDGIAAVVIIKSQLNYSLNLILVLFIVLFPIVVLAIFFRLVTNHHNKLYAPSDYKDENNFIRSFDNRTQSTVDVPVLEYYQNANKQLNKEKMQLNRSLRKLKRQIGKVNYSASGYKQDTEKTSVKIEKTGNEMNKELYKVSVNGKKPQAAMLVNQYERLGFVSEVYKPILNMEENYDAQEAIWLGNEVPLEMVQAVIKAAHEFYPDLKYIHISSDIISRDTPPDYIHKEIFVGGSTDTAEKRYLKALTNSDFDEIIEFKDLNKLHEFIRSSYCNEY
ncbi:hypothetical protein FGG79_11725 [Bacillus sp. BHET2]|uniref:hypothetical protein n=1 Tax=Bacillus sp. BHET2 TaxID=2583818 RepID=UPI00110EE4B0|nr:hypothetical protein [Bacillus sp. BHET2]TMU85859.1 hypothetical protein FGG79_11725 [Bacillus sp. BHET2]